MAGSLSGESFVLLIHSLLPKDLAPHVELKSISCGGAVVINAEIKVEMRNAIIAIGNTRHMQLAELNEDAAYDFYDEFMRAWVVASNL